MDSASFIEEVLRFMSKFCQRTSPGSNGWIVGCWFRLLHIFTDNSNCPSGLSGSFLVNLKIKYLSFKLDLQEPSIRHHYISECANLRSSKVAILSELIFVFTLLYITFFQIFLIMFVFLFSLVMSRMSYMFPQYLQVGPYFSFFLLFLLCVVLESFFVC